MAGVPAPPIITCPAWGARPPRSRPRLVGRPERILFHHTAGHARPLAPQHPDAHRQAVEYARLLQADMIDRRGWIDSGHNFLVMRSGVIVQGRWGTVSAIEQGRMVESAHCPGQNDQPGIEHEHTDSERTTAAQLEATAWLHAWIMDHCSIRPTEIYGHSHFYPTSCPGSLGALLPELRLTVSRKLTVHGRNGPSVGTIRALWRSRAGSRLVA